MNDDALGYWLRFAWAIAQVGLAWLALRWLWPRLVRWAERGDHHPSVAKLIRPGVQLLHRGDRRVDKAKPVSATIPPADRPGDTQAGD